MHEAALIQGLISIAEQALLEQALAEKHPARVKTLRVAVGPLSGALPDALSFAFEAAADGMFAGARLELMPGRVLARCADCGGEYEPQGFPYACPVCGCNRFQIVSGEDVVLESIEYDEV